MARIPLSDIPNAPSIGEPTLYPQLPHTQGLQPLDVSGEALDRSGLDRTRSLLGDAREDLRRGTDAVSRAKENTQSPMIDPRPFLAPYEGMEDVARAFQHSAGVTEQFAHSMALAGDANTMAQASIAMHQGFSAHANDIAQGKIPYTDYVKTWQEKKLPEIRERIEALPQSPRIRQRLANDLARFSSEASIQFGQAATQKHIATIGGNLLNAGDLALSNGNVEEAYHQYEEARRVGAISEKQFQVKWDGAQQIVRTQQALDAVERNPYAFVEDLEKARKTGESELLPWAGRAEQESYRALARDRLQTQQADASDEIDRDLAGGKVANGGQIRERATINHVPEADIQSMERSLDVKAPETPREHAAYAVALNRIDSDVSQYVAAQDPDGSKYRALTARVRETAFGGDREPWLDQLTAARKDRGEGISRR